MKKGGFSISSCPTFIIKSAFAMARCKKSLADSAAFPKNKGSRSSNTPFPICVLIKGIWVLSTKARNILAGIFRLDPAPIKSSGFFAFSIISTACLIAFPSATGRRARLRGSGWDSASSPATSSGNSKCAAPGRSSWEILKASRIIEGMLFPLTIECVYLVNGRIISTTSRIWNLPCLLCLTGFCPVIITIGIAAS